MFKQYQSSLYETLLDIKHIFDVTRNLNYSNCHRPLKKSFLQQFSADKELVLGIFMYCGSLSAAHTWPTDLGQLDIQVIGLVIMKAGGGVIPPSLYGCNKASSWRLCEGSVKCDIGHQDSTARGTPSVDTTFSFLAHYVGYQWRLADPGSLVQVSDVRRVHSLLHDYTIINHKIFGSGLSN